MTGFSSLSLSRPVIGITLGDAAGIGPEVVKKALESGQLPAHGEYHILGPVHAATPGKPDKASAQAAWNGLREAGEALKNRRVSAVVTAPVCKSALMEVGFRWPGQTEFFAETLGATDFTMILSGKRLTVALVTIHVPLSEVPALLTEQAIGRAARHLTQFLQAVKGIEQPHIAVAGLNPHAGENGAFGTEEQTLIRPAVEKLAASLANPVSGPHSPDTVFNQTLNGRFDGVVCMYHDQGLIPLKLLDFDNAVNITMGLSAPRTSPDHGTAFEIAGLGQADAGSMIEAIRMAVHLAEGGAQPPAARPAQLFS